MKIRMQFSKTTKNTTVFVTDDALAPTDNIYVSTDELRARGLGKEDILLTVSDKPFTGESDEISMTIAMRISRTTKTKTLFEAVNANAPVDRIYMTSEWLESKGFEDTLHFRIAAAPDEDPDAAFDAFLGTTIIRRRGGELTTDRIWVRWASLNDGSLDAEVIADIHKNSVARRFRARFSPPPAAHGRVDGRVQRRWEGYAVIQS